MNQEIQKLQEQVKVLTDQVNILVGQNLTLQNDLKALSTVYYKDNFPSQQAFRKDITFFGKVGFFGKPVSSQFSAITPPVGGVTVDNQARTAISQIITVLQTLGITL